MKITLDPEADAVYIQLQEGKCTRRRHPQAVPLQRRRRPSWTAGVSPALRVNKPVQERRR